MFVSFWTLGGFGGEVKVGKKVGVEVGEKVGEEVGEEAGEEVSKGTQHPASAS